jgi:hypothetical protein
VLVQRLDFVPFFFFPLLLFMLGTLIVRCRTPIPLKIISFTKGAKTPQKLSGQINACIALNANIIIMNPVVIHPKPESNEKFYTPSR